MARNADSWGDGVVYLWCFATRRFVTRGVPLARNLNPAQLRKCRVVMDRETALR